MNIVSDRILPRYRRKLLIILSGVMSIAIATSSAYGAIIAANPDNYRNLIGSLQAGDTLQLEAGSYERGLPISNRHGEPGNPIIITGPETGDPAVFLGSRAQAWNTVQIDNSSYLTLRHLKLDGLDVAFIDAVNSRGVTHHITLEYLEIVRHGAHQLTTGIATRGPAWGWIIRNCKIMGAGTGMYLGHWQGKNWPFVGGLIEHNMFVDTVGYNFQIKQMNSRSYENGDAIPGMPLETDKTIIRHNVFSKATQPTPPQEGARPNLLVGHFPLNGPGSDDVYEIYGNLFYENTTEALFQGEGNIALYDNLFINSSGSAINIQPHNDVPRSIDVYHNTIVATGSGVRIQGANANFVQRAMGNAIFSGTPMAVSAQVIQQDNVTDTYAAASDYLINPTGDINLGELDLFPKAEMLSAAAMDLSLFQSFSDANLDFNRDQRDGTYRGAYAGEADNNGWRLAVDFKPRGEVVPQAPDITTQPESLTVTEGEDAIFSVVATGSSLLTYQWYFNGAEISGANSTSYMLTAVNAADAGTYGCIVTNDEGSDSCVDATLTVSADVLAPTLVTASATSDTTVDILFSEAVNAVSAETSANYQLNLGISVDAASLNADERSVRLTISPALTEETTYTVSVSNIQDQASSPNTIIGLSTETFTYRTADDFEDGAADGWTPFNGGDNVNVNRWEVVADEGDNAYFLNTTGYSNLDGKRLGEYSLLAAQYGDFTFTAQAKLGDDVGSNTHADYAVLFGFQDNENYYYILFNNDQGSTQIAKIEDGSRVELATAESDWLNDNAYHTIKVSRLGSEITVYFDESWVMNASDSTFGNGLVGVGSYNDSAYFDDVKVVGQATTTPDTTVPVITLTGDDPQTITVGEAYSELGASATDNKDGDISDNITTDAATVNTAVAGAYNVTYNVSDAAGNAAIEVIRIVNVAEVVIDDTAPEITLTGINPQMIIAGNIYTELGATATDNVDGDISGNITMDAAAVNTAIAGSYNVTYNVSDAAGNAAIEVIRIVNVEEVVIDGIVPVITLVGNNPQTITVGNVYADAGATAMDNIDGNLTTSIQTVNLVDTANAGTYEVTYDVSDAAGNAAIQVTRTVNVTAAATINPDDSGGGAMGWWWLAILMLSFHRANAVLNKRRVT
ncbi:MAG: DUF5011 domain-containing protein [Gammaproteobacteria bacterium]|nr:DUF5011 domain-containing protein [Gammaproteobacteria bacterium]